MPLHCRISLMMKAFLLEEHSWRIGLSCNAIKNRDKEQLLKIFSQECKNHPVEAKCKNSFQVLTDCPGSSCTQLTLNCTMVDPASRKKTHMKHHLLRKSSEDPPPFTVHFQGVDLLQVFSYPQQYVHKEQVSEQPNPNKSQLWVFTKLVTIPFGKNFWTQEEEELQCNCCCSGKSCGNFFFFFFFFFLVWLKRRRLTLFCGNVDHGIFF